MVRRAAALLLFGALLAGCGGSGETKTVTETAAGGSSSAAEPPPETTGSSAESTPAPPEEGKALAARAGAVDGDKVRLEIVELARSGGITALTFRLSRSDEEDEGTSQVGDTFDDGIFQKSTEKDADSIVGGSTLDGIYLVDAKNRKKYLVGRDADNLCACDGDLGSTSVSVDSPVLLSATFGAPPEDVSAVDVFIPSFGTFKDVPLG